ncbi:hypothetical protein AGMMS4952_22500 [Spirochaetia bacterium]|nr:hypothetical protein AGMMS4952_22500 [Spirochaetia bacterium]
MPITVERKDEIPTFEQIWEMLRETDRIIKETAQSQKETGEQMKESDRKFQAMSQETDRILKEAAQSRKETDQIIKETVQSQKEADRSITRMSDELRRSGEDVDRRIKEVTEQLGGMGNSNGAFAEDYFATAMSDKKMFAGLKFDDVEINMKGKVGAIKDEFDIVMYNGNAVAIIEVKYKAQTEDLEKMVTKKVSNFRTLFPYYADHKVYLGIGSMSSNEYVYAKAKELGIGMLKQNGDTIEADTSFVRAY